MAFRFNKWEEAFQDDQLVATIKRTLESELNSSESGLVSLKVSHLNFGTRPPLVRLHDIPVVTEKRLLVLLKVDYDGDAALGITARLSTGGGSPFWSTNVDSIPVSVILESIRVSGMVAVEVKEVIPGSRDISIRFLNDPLESISVSSSLDRQLPFVKSLLYAHISAKLRELFTVDLPELAKHRIDLHFLAPTEPSTEFVSNLARFSELAGQPPSGFAMIARDAASLKSANSRGVILTKTSLMKRWQP